MFSSQTEPPVGVSTRRVRGFRTRVGLRRESEPRMFWLDHRCVDIRRVSSAPPPIQKSRRRSAPNWGRRASVFLLRRKQSA